MTLNSLDIPDDVDQLAIWLERQLAGPDLGLLVAELSVIANDDADDTSFEQLLGDGLPDVLTGGLRSVSSETLRGLLRRPALLLELQQRVLADGGAYWDRVLSESSEIEAIAERGRTQLDRTTESLAAVSPAAAARKWYLHPLVLSCATAAVVLIAAFVVMQNRSQPPTAAVAWGWAKPDALPAGAKPAEYFQQLADGANEWFNKRPETSHDVAIRLAQFRQGCTVLILAEHKPLAEDDRTWLIDKCKLWATKLDAHLVDLESGRPALEVRGEIDETVRKLISALRERAEKQTV